MSLVSTLSERLETARAFRRRPSVLINDGYQGEVRSSWINSFLVLALGPNAPVLIRDYSARRTRFRKSTDEVLDVRAK